MTVQELINNREANLSLEEIIAWVDGDIFNFNLEWIQEQINKFTGHEGTGLNASLDFNDDEIETWGNEEKKALLNAEFSDDAPVYTEFDI